MLIGVIVFTYIVFIKKPNLTTKEIGVPSTYMKQQTDSLANSVSQLSVMVYNSNHPTGNEVTPR